MSLRSNYEPALTVLEASSITLSPDTVSAHINAYNHALSQVLFVILLLAEYVLITAITTILVHLSSP